MSHARITNPASFAKRVDAALRAETGGLGIWDMVGDWPEADFAAQNDVDGAIQWILDEAGETHMWF
jgi:hypothetical protein